MYSDKLALRHREQTEGIIVSHIRLGYKGELSEVLESPYIVGRNSRLYHHFPIRQNLIVCPLYRLNKTFELYFFYFRSFERFIF